MSEHMGYWSRCTARVLCMVTVVSCSTSNNDELGAGAPLPRPEIPEAPPTTPPPLSPDVSNTGSTTSGSDDPPARGQDSPSIEGGVGPSGVTENSSDRSDAGTDDPPAPDCFSFMNDAGSSRKTPYPGGRWTVPPATYGTVIEADVEIEMSDGVVLVGDVSYPTDLANGGRAAGTFPVILTQNPYGAALFGPQYGEIFVAHGYIFATVDVRGTTRSGGGVHDLFSPREADDGAELVSWAATLEGSDGRVGLQGCSQLGINQLETATRLGPDSPVKAMIPACPSGDFYRDTVFDNGIPSITAGFLVPGAAMGDDTAYYREYWQTRDRVARAPAIARADIPTLLWSGWHEPGALGSLDLYTVLQNVAAGRPAHAPVTAGQEVSGKYQVIIGDWGHGGGLDLGIELQWYDTWIKGIDTGLSKNTTSPLHLAELGGTQRWINARCYPLVQRYTPLFLSAGGRLARSADSDQGQAELRWTRQELAAETVEYTSEPFADGAMLAGPIAAQLQVTSSNTNLQLFVEVLDRAPNGTLSRIGFGSIIGGLRQTNPEKTWTDDNGLPTRPSLALVEDEPMTPGGQTQLDVPLGPTVWSIEPGHGIAVRVSTHPQSEECIGVIVPPVGCYPTEPMLDTLAGGVYRLHLGGELGSLVSLPLLDHGALPTVESAASPTGNSTDPLPVDW